MLKDIPETTDEMEFRPRGDSFLERRQSQVDIPFRRKRADSVSIVTVDTADLDCQFTRPDEEQEDKIIEEEKAETGSVCGILLSFVTAIPRVRNFIYRCKVATSSFIGGLHVLPDSLLKQMRDHVQPVSYPTGLYITLNILMK